MQSLHCGSYGGHHCNARFADAGEKPPEVTEEERVFPDPDSFSYDDVEINFAKALQYSLYFTMRTSVAPASPEAIWNGGEIAM